MRKLTIFDWKINYFKIDELSVCAKNKITSLISYPETVKKLDEELVEEAKRLLDHHSSSVELLTFLTEIAGRKVYEKIQKKYPDFDRQMLTKMVQEEDLDSFGILLSSDFMSENKELRNVLNNLINQRSPLPFHKWLKQLKVDIIKKYGKEGDFQAVKEFLFLDRNHNAIAFAIEKLDGEFFEVLYNTDISQLNLEKFDFAGLFRSYNDMYLKIRNSAMSRTDNNYSSFYDEREKQKNDFVRIVEIFSSRFPIPIESKLRLFLYCSDLYELIDADNDFCNHMIPISREGMIKSLSLLKVEDFEDFELCEYFNQDYRMIGELEGYSDDKLEIIFELACTVENFEYLNPQLKESHKGILIPIIEKKMLEAKNRQKEDLYNYLVEFLGELRTLKITC